MVTYVGQPVRLRCMVSDRATIHWSREGLPLPPNARIKDDYLDLPRVRLEDSGRYICQTQTSHGVSSDYVNLNVSRKLKSMVSITSCMVFFLHFHTFHFSRYKSSNIIRQHTIKKLWLEGYVLYLIVLNCTWAWIILDWIQFSSIWAKLIISKSWYRFDGHSFYLWLSRYCLLVLNLRTDCTRVNPMQCRESSCVCSVQGCFLLDYYCNVNAIFYPDNRYYFNSKRWIPHYLQQLGGLFCFNKLCVPDLWCLLDS